MTDNCTVDYQDFAIGIESLLGDIPEEVGDEINKAVKSSVKLAAKNLRDNLTAGIGVHPWSDKFRKGFSSKVDAKGLVTTGHVGNKSQPGLVHLLEKGHHTLTERRTRAFPHMAPAFDEMQEDFMEKAEKALERAVS